MIARSNTSLLVKRTSQASYGTGTRHSECLRAGSTRCRTLPGAAPALGRADVAAEHLRGRRLGWWCRARLAFDATSARFGHCGHRAHCSADAAVRGPGKVQRASSRENDGRARHFHAAQGACVKVSGRKGSAAACALPAAPSRQHSNDVQHLER